MAVNSLFCRAAIQRAFDLEHMLKRRFEHRVSRLSNTTLYSTVCCKGRLIAYLSCTKRGNPSPNCQGSSTVSLVLLLSANWLANWKHTHSTAVSLYFQCYISWAVQRCDIISLTMWFLIAWDHEGRKGLSRIDLYLITLWKISFSPWNFFRNMFNTVLVLYTI